MRINNQYGLEVADGAIIYPEYVADLGDLGEVLIDKAFMMALLSVSLLSERGYTFEFKHRMLYILLPNYKTITVHEEHRIYRVHIDDITTTVTSGKSLAKANKITWHNRLAHNSYIPKHLPVIRQPDDRCKACTTAKKKNKNTNKERQHEPSTEPLELVFVDIIGPFTTSIGNNTHAVSIIDDMSDMAKEYPVGDLKATTILDAMFHTFDEWYILSRRRVQCIQMDRGSQFTANVTRRMLAYLGYCTRYAPTATPQYHGKVERVHGTLIPRMLATLSFSRLPKSMWAESLTQITNIYNAMPVDNHSLSPYEKFTGHPFPIEMFRTFGCHVAYKNRDPDGKFDDRALDGILIAQPLDTTPDSYRIYSPITKRILQSRDVYIFEEEFFVWEGNKCTITIAPPDTASYNKQLQFAEMEAIEYLDAESTEEGNTHLQIDQQPARNEPQQLRITAPSSQQTEITEEQTEQSQPPAAPAKTQTELEATIARRTAEGRQVSRELRDLAIDDNNIDWYHNNHRKRRQSCVKTQTVNLATSTLEPKTFKGIYDMPNAAEWENSARAEIESLVIQRKAFTLVDNKPREKSIFPPRWVFKAKTDEAGQITRLKSRLNVAAFNAKQGIDYNESFAPVVAKETLRICLALMAHYDMDIRQYDTPSAYLTQKLDTPSYMRVPQGYDLIEDMLDQQQKALYARHKLGDRTVVCRVDRCVYGLPPSGYFWFEAVRKFATKHGYKQSQSDGALFIKQTDKGPCFIIVHVDDKIAACQSKEDGQRLADAMHKEWRTVDMGIPLWFLKCEVDIQPGCVRIHQRQYLKEVLQEWGLIDCKPSWVPILESDYEVTDKQLYLPEKAVSSEVPTIKQYNKLVGQLRYLVDQTRVDICFAVSILSRHLINPQYHHFRGAKRCLKYLAGTQDLGLEYTNKQPCVPYLSADSSFASDGTSKRSTTGRVGVIAGAPFMWGTNLQRLVTTSTAEAEYVAQSDTAKDAVWARNLFTEFGIPLVEPTTLEQDNKSAILMGQGITKSRRTKHVDLRYHHIRELTANNTIHLKYIPSDQLLSDFFTKPLNREKFTAIRDRLMAHLPT